jgi:signal transduction histidine kinase
LGLPIAKTLVEGMKGKIKMESEIGKGSVVILCF